MKKIIQFGYSVAIPEGVVNGTIPAVDCRTIHNPYPRFKDNAIGAFYAVCSDPEFPGKVGQALQLLTKCDVIAIGCGYGVHRSGAVVLETRRIASPVWGEIEVVNLGRAG